LRALRLTRDDDGFGVIPLRAVLDAAVEEWLETTSFVDPKTGERYEPDQAPVVDDPRATRTHADATRNQTSSPAGPQLHRHRHRRQEVMAPLGADNARLGRTHRTLFELGEMTASGRPTVS
jgi:hypothetical protein